MKKRNFEMRGFALAERILAHNPRQKSAFTLAEVLITLVIIGVIGALTVPSLIQNTQKQEYVSALKKAYSTLSQAVQMIISEEGSPKGDAGWAKNNEQVYNLFKKYLINVKDCGSNTGCWEQGAYKYKYLSGRASIDDWDSSRTTRIVLNDGMQIMIAVTNNNCSINNEINNVGSKEYCSYIRVDLNGSKAPNTVGRDIFNFVLKENGLFPAGCDTESDVCSRRNDGNGCACKVLREGAMNY